MKVRFSPLRPRPLLEPGHGRHGIRPGPPIGLRPDPQDMPPYLLIGYVRIDPKVYSPRINILPERVKPG